MLDMTPTARMSKFLAHFGQALETGNIDEAVSLFAPECYWRDLVAFTWNIKTVEGRERRPRHACPHCLQHVKPRNWQVAEGETATEAGGVSEAWISFETEVARGYGLIRLQGRPDLDAADHHGRAEGARGKGRLHQAARAPSTASTLAPRAGRKSARPRRPRSASTTQPYVVIIGGGQGGIALGARLRQLGVPTIIVEKNERAGDSWRKRYKSLCLHDPVWYDHLPYLDFPKNWPVFSPKDKIGDWLEMYTKVMELNYWTSTTAKQRTYDEARKEWTRRRRARRQGDRAAAQAAGLRHRHVRQGQPAEVQGHGPLQGRAAPLLPAPGAGRL